MLAIHQYNSGDYFEIRYEYTPKDKCKMLNYIYRRNASLMLPLFVVPA